MSAPDSERQRVAGLLVAAVAAVGGVHVDLEPELARELRRPVAARVVHEDELVGDAGRDREHRALQRLLRLVGGHRDHDLGQPGTPIDVPGRAGDQPWGGIVRHPISLGRGPRSR